MRRKDVAPGCVSRLRSMERKLATVLLVELVDSSALVAASDPEIVRRRVTQFFDRVSHCIQTHGGTVEKFAGDAIMAAFGIPQAHEDDAERAVRATLGILESMRELELEARIGVEAGEVVTDDGDSTFATGEAVNLAARLQQNAEPGQILMRRTGSHSAASKSTRSARWMCARATSLFGPGRRSARTDAHRPASPSRHSSDASTSSSYSRTPSPGRCETVAPTSSPSTVSRASEKPGSRMSFSLRHPSTGERLRLLS
jgi:class 3 adenylate cyclase